MDASVQYPGFGDFTDPLDGRNAVPSHWEYKMTRNGAGDVQRYQARLVCGVDDQIERIDYQAMYAETGHLGQVRLALAIAS